MKRGQRERLEKGLARAEIVMDQMERKVNASKSRSRRQEQRRGQWENINGAVKEETRKATKVPGREPGEEEWEDVKEGERDDLEMQTTEAVQPVDVIPVSSGDKNEDSTNVVQDELDLIT